MKLLPRDNSDNGEKGSLGFPALGAAASVIMKNIARKGNFDRAGLAVTSKLAA